MRKLRFLPPVLMLGLVLWVIPALCPKPPAESLEEYYGRLYPRQVCVGPTLDAVVYDYARLKEEAKAILVDRIQKDAYHDAAVMVREVEAQAR